MYSDKIKLDKFYTKKNVAKSCIDLIDNLNDYDLIIEPSVGGGSFFNNLKEYNVLGIDLDPTIKHEDIITHDWLTYNIDFLIPKVLVIGNPPFGKRNKLSVDFIKHAALFNNVYSIAFVLPDVYNKHTLQKNIPKEFRLKTIFKLPYNSFEVDGEEYHVPCSFFVFEKSSGTCLRFNPDNYKETVDWTYGTKEDADFYIMGASPKTVKELKDVEPNNRGYYIKLKENKDKDKIIEKFKNLKWGGHSSANGGVAWMTKPEIVKNYMEK